MHFYHESLVPHFVERIRCVQQNEGLSSQGSQTKKKDVPSLLLPKNGKVTFMLWNGLVFHVRGFRV